MNNNIINFIESAINQNQNKLSLSDYQGQSMTYAAVAQKINYLHILFEKSGVKKNDKIALIGKNSAKWTLVYLASITYGAVIVPILPDFHSSEMIHIINHSDSVILFAGQSFFEQLDENEMLNIKSVFSLDDFSILYSIKKNFQEKINKIPQENSFQKTVSFEDIALEQTASIVYTSGTTGYSKGVCLSVKNLTQNIVYAKNNMPLKPGDNILSFLPLAHAYGCAFEFLFPFCIGCHITFLNKIPSPKIIVKAFSEIKPQLILSVPLIIEKIYYNQIKPVINSPKMQLLLKTPIINKLVKNKIQQKLNQVFGNNFHEIVIGGAALNSEVEEFLTSVGFRFTIGYGMTECGPLISYSSWSNRKLKTCGKVVHSLEIKIDSPDPQNIVGEIFVKGDNVMKEYYKNDEATQEAIDKESWLHTGDLGIIDKDGFIFIKGRKKNMLLGSSGQNIYPEEIEAKLNSMNYIQESMIIEENGKIIALIYPDLVRKDLEKLSDSDFEKILLKNRDEINKKLPDYSKILKFKLVPQEFEKTPTKKIKRFLYS